MKKVVDPCAICGKSYNEHTARDLHCPSGRKHRVFGYTCFSQTTYEPKKSKASKDTIPGDIAKRDLE